MAAGFWYKAFGVFWAALGLILYPNTLSPRYGLDGLIATLIIFSLFPGISLYCIGDRKNRRFKWKQKYLAEQEPYLVQFRIELQKLEYEQELAREERERAEEAEEAARLEAEKEATLAALRAETEAAARREAASRTSPVPPPSSSPPTLPLMPKNISCPGCGAKKVLQPMQSVECDYCGTVLVYS
ncbi:hypothetical protein BBD42_14830 [Paenibacillus sp. BIHB 4019]|uniref:Uncharacterized protein n=1 Tax=Paenibacillus sp. BIHB 4019 TaxID=1870819 RepID=A0A1B2DIU0_9BACL|nr:hypothetical protein [Paenibacillus sp. BIHB 4019]ANY67609.1 hypothetical protein BBD42_14830 [Paenibacillus sp. BIHB 4019]